MVYRVSITRTDNGVGEAAKKAVNLLGGIGRFIPQGETVLLKPNLFAVKGPETGATTDLRIVTAIHELLRENGNESVIGECPAMSAYTRPDMVFNGLGVRDHGIPVSVLDRETPVKRSIEGVILRDIWFPETALRCPIINFPKLKTHTLTSMTCAVKNLFGLQQGGSKAHHHVHVHNDAEAFSNLLLDIYQAIRPQVKLNVVDAHIAMEGEGPASGDPVNMGLIIAGDDAVAVDIVAAAIMDWDPLNEVGTNHLAVKRGLGPSSLDEIQVVGESIESVMTPMRRPQIHSDGEMFIKIRMPIEVNKEKCIVCGVCEKVCPVQAIKLDETPLFDMEKCIQCFCCVELCPHNALKAIRPDG